MNVPRKKKNMKYKYQMKEIKEKKKPKNMKEK